MALWSPQPLAHTHPQYTRLVLDHPEVRLQQSGSTRKVLFYFIFAIFKRDFQLIIME